MMEKFKQIIITIALSYACVGYAQINDSSEVKPLSLPVENVYLHLNTNTIFSGENLYFKVYVTADKELLSKYSKIAYIQLISPKRKIVITQKIKLTQGVGYGDFLISAEIPTGNYKLMAYTKLGLKQANHNIFSTDLSIINPYIQLKSEFVSIDNDVSSNYEIPKVIDIDSKIKIGLKDSVFNKRQKVELKLFTEDQANFGNYSISVKKLDVFQCNHSTSILRHEKYQRLVKVRNGLNFLPDLRGDLITGKISSNKENIPIENQRLALLIPDEDFKLKLGKTDKNGRFFFNIEESYFSNKAFIQVLNEANSDYSFVFEDQPEPELSSLTFNKLKLDNNLKAKILKRSIKNQIETSYSSVKMNTFNPPKYEVFFGEIGEKYNLDDYKRFPVLNQTFVEIIKGVSFEKNKAGYDIKIRATDYTVQSPLKAMVLVDGLLIKDHSLLYNFDAKKVKTITVINDKYYYGGNVFQGILSIETFDKSYHNFIQLQDVQMVTILNPMPEKIYHKVVYEADKNLEHIPDFRTQLIWKPDLKIDTAETPLEFYTSDETGTYEIVIEGISNTGEKIRATETFKVM